MKGIWVKVRNYDKFKGRSDIKQKTWFRCSNDLLEDEDFFEFEPAEILVWIYILSQSSMKQCDEIFINFERAERFARLKKKDVISAIEKLLGNQLLPVCRTDDVRMTNGSRTDHERDQNSLPPATNGTERNEQNRTERNGTNAIGAVVEATPDPAELASVEDLKTLAGKENIQAWSKLYEDSEFIDRELLKAFQYYQNNAKKKPKSRRGWVAAASSWLERGWSWRAKNIKGIAAGSEADLSDLPWEDTGGTA